MKKLVLSAAAEEFDMIDSETHLFYNTLTGEFDFYTDYMTAEEADAEKFEDDMWVAAPSQWDFGEYDIMADFAESVDDPHKNELLTVALEGRGAFRRFKDTLSRVDLEDEWYAFKHKAFMGLAKDWCEENGIEYIDDSGSGASGAAHPSEHDALTGESGDVAPVKIAVSMVTLESHNHIVGDIERGVRVFESGGVEFDEREPGIYWARVPHKKGSKVVSVVFSKDGRDIKAHTCNCSSDYRNPVVCRHVVSTVLAIQGGIVESGLSLGKSASVSDVVSEKNTASAVWSGSLDVFATPMMIALMERAACECLADGLDTGETSVGTEVNVSHTAASPLGMEVTATATIEFVFGRKVEFVVTASDSSGEIGKGRHSRVIVDKDRFLGALKQPMNSE